MHSSSCAKSGWMRSVLLWSSSFSIMWPSIHLLPIRSSPTCIFQEVQSSTPCVAASRREEGQYAGKFLWIRNSPKESQLPAHSPPGRKFSNLPTHLCSCPLWLPSLSSPSGYNPRGPVQRLRRAETNPNRQLAAIATYVAVHLSVKEATP